MPVSGLWQHNIKIGKSGYIISFFFKSNSLPAGRGQARQGGDDLLDTLC
jgi:hypothetical protein